MFGQNNYSFTMEASPETGRSKRKREAKADLRALVEAGVIDMDVSLLGEPDFGE